MKNRESFEPNEPKTPEDKKAEDLSKEHQEKKEKKSGLFIKSEEFKSEGGIKDLMDLTRDDWHRMELWDISHGYAKNPSNFPEVDRGEISLEDFVNLPEVKAAAKEGVIKFLEEGTIENALQYSTEYKLPEEKIIQSAMEKLTVELSSKEEASKIQKSEIIQSVIKELLVKLLSRE